MVSVFHELIAKELRKIGSKLNKNHDKIYSLFSNIYNITGVFPHCSFNMFNTF